MCAVVLAAIWPSLAGLPLLPGRVVVGDVYAVTQGSGTRSIEDRLVENLSAQSWAEVVSPEILVFTAIHDSPVVIRGATRDAFLRLESAVVLEEAPSILPGAYAGEGLARRLGLRLGDSIALVGSGAPRLAVLRIDGIFSAPTTARDELLLDLETARSLSGLTERVYHSIRVKTSDPAALLAFLESSGESVHVYGPGIGRVDILSDPPADQRLLSIVLRFGSAPIPRDAVAAAMSIATNSVLVVALGLAAFVGLLVALAIHGVQARAFADRRRAVGVLRAVGAGHGWIRARAMAEGLPVAVAAAILGTAVGAALGVALRPITSFVFFGHEVVAAFDPIAYALVVVLVVLASALSSLVLVAGVLRETPAESIQERAMPEAPRALEAVL